MPELPSLIVFLIIIAASTFSIWILKRKHVTLGTASYDAKLVEDPVFRERMLVFRDREHAGRLLAEKLRKYNDNKKVILLALPLEECP